jgi:chromosome partitioning protein
MDRMLLVMFRRYGSIKKETVAPMKARIACVAAHKGGVGKTTTSLALSAALARRGDPVLLVDLDPQGHSTTGLGVELPESALTVRDVLIDLVEIERAICGTSVPNLSILPSRIDLEPGAQTLSTRTRRDEILRRALSSVRSVFRWIVIDCPPSLGALTENAVAAADVAIIPCRMEARATDGLVDLLELAGILHGEGWNAWRILKTQIDKRKAMTNAAVMAALQRFDAHLLETEIPQSEPLNQAQIARQDVFSFAPSCSGAEAYVQLAGEISTAWQTIVN